VDENRRNTTRRERKPMIGSAKGGKTDKIIDLGRKHNSQDFDKFM
jgi:hypothetical protein